MDLFAAKGEPATVFKMLKQRAEHSELMNISTQVTNRPISNSILISDLPLGAVFEVTTVNRIYTVENRGEGRILISGHPKYCPEPVLVDQFGSASICTLPVIGPGLCLAYRHPRHGRIRTSRVESIREITRDPAGPAGA